MDTKKLYRPNSGRRLAGVCAAIAQYIDVDVTLVRLLYVILSLFSAAFPGLLLYVICALIIPSES